MDARLSTITVVQTITVTIVPQINNLQFQGCYIHTRDNSCKPLTDSCWNILRSCSGSHQLSDFLISVHDTKLCTVLRIGRDYVHYTLDKVCWIKPCWSQYRYLVGLSC
jgi:hypothetical protein